MQAHIRLQNMSTETPTRDSIICQLKAIFISQPDRHSFRLLFGIGIYMHVYTCIFRQKQPLKTHFSAHMAGNRGVRGLQVPEDSSKNTIQLCRPIYANSYQTPLFLKLIFFIPI